MIKDAWSYTKKVSNHDVFILHQTKPLLGSPRRLGQIPGQETTRTPASYRPNRHTLYGTAVKQLWSSYSGEAIDQYKHRAKRK